tara:strand:- start:144 stop:488 length:345 start_codon:yes stop_codon:yes gene_type:complete
MSCVLGFFVLFIFIFILIIFGQGCYYKDEIVQHFTNLKPAPKADSVYGEFKRNIDSMKTLYKIGEPPGILKFSNNPDLECDTNKNLLVQSNVAFRQSRTKEGCTYIDKIWPGGY